MFIVHVDVKVKLDKIEEFKAASLENAVKSVKEPGIFRFDVIQQQDDASRFMLIEIYRDAQAPALHKQTAHYKKWADVVCDMMAAPRCSTKYVNIFPVDWK